MRKGDIKRIWTWIADSWVLLAGIAVAGGGSFSDLQNLATRSGEHGLTIITSALIFDLAAIGCAREMQRDRRTSRAHGGILSAPATAFFIFLTLTLTGNLCAAVPDLPAWLQLTWGLVFHAAPASVVMVMVGLIERRTNYVRRAVRKDRRNQSGNPEAPGSGNRVPDMAGNPVPDTGLRRGRPALPEWVIPSGLALAAVHDAADEPARVAAAVAAILAANPERSRVPADIIAKTLKIRKRRVLDILNAGDTVREAAG